MNRMIEEAVRDPGRGIGKPERLADDLIVVQAGYHC
jgi:Txe/YoeB family toxin of Txe-Axe toxin-antitoxin module